MGDLGRALVTVTNDAFVAGTLVMVQSFLTHNRWFDGEVVVIHDALSEDALSEASRRYLSLAFDRIRFLAVGDQLRRHVDAVVRERPDLAPVQPRFWSLETFRLTEYGQVLFCDSDVLVRQSMHELFEMPHEFIACGDGPHYLRQAIDGPGPGARFDTSRTFNTGVFLVNRSCLASPVYSDLIQATVPATFRDAHAGRTDSIVMNLCLGPRVHLAGAEFNYLLGFRAAIAARHGVGMSKARAWHFNTPNKPWVANQAVRGTMADAAYGVACAAWTRSYAECLKHLSLRNRLAAMRADA